MCIRDRSSPCPINNLPHSWWILLCSSCTWCGRSMEHMWWVIHVSHHWIFHPCCVLFEDLIKKTYQSKVNRGMVFGNFCGGGKLCMHVLCLEGSIKWLIIPTVGVQRATVSVKCDFENYSSKRKEHISSRRHMY